MCCSGFLKMMMFLFNGVIFVIGVAILAVGVWLKVDSGSLLGILDTVEDAPAELSYLINITYLLIGLGAVLLLIGFLGCCGAVKESRCMLLTFFSIVLIIFLAEVAVAVILFVFQDLTPDLLKKVENEVIGTIKKKYGEDEDLTSLWDGAMKQFHCCGALSYKDFEGSPFNNQSSGSFPPACCVDVSTAPCDESEASESTSEVDGCMKKLVQLIEENADIIAGVALGIAAIEIAAMVVSMVLYSQIGTKA